MLAAVMPAVAGFQLMLGAHRTRVLPTATPAMSLVKVPGEPDGIQSMLSQAEGAAGIVCLYFTERKHFLSNDVVARTAADYASSMLYGGPSCSIIELKLPEANVPSYAQALELCSERGVTELPCAMVWSKGSLVKQVPPAELEGVLLQLGARSPSSKFNSGNRDFGKSGLPSATAVDDIDFTGGAGNKGRPNLDWGLNAKGKSDAGRTTADRFPSWFGGVDKPGDGMRDNETPGEARARKERERDDRPPGFDGRD